MQKDIKDLTGAEWREVISQAMIFMWGRVNIFWFDQLHKSEFLVFVRSWTPGWKTNLANGTRWVDRRPFTSKWNTKWKFFFPYGYIDSVNVDIVDIGFCCQLHCKIYYCDVIVIVAFNDVLMLILVLFFFPDILCSSEDIYFASQGFHAILFWAILDWDPQCWRQKGGEDKENFN